MKKYLILLLVTISTLANAQRPVKRFIENQTDSHVNILLNAGAENGTVGAVASVASDLIVDTNAGYGVRAFKWSPAGSSRNIAFSNGATPLSLRGKSCLAKAEYAGTNFAAGEIVIRVEDNGTPITADLDLVPTATASTFQKVEIAFICPNTGTNLSIKLVNIVSGKIIWLDQLWLGNDYRLGIEPPKITAWQTFTPVWAGTTATRANEVYEWRRNGENLELNVKLTISATTGSTSNLILNLPSDAGVDLTGYTTGATTSSGSLGYGGGFLNGAYQTIHAYVNNTTQINFAARVGNGLSWNEFTAIGDSFHLSLSFPVAQWRGTGTTETVTLETQGWIAEGEIFGSTAISLVLGNQTSWAEATRSDLTLDLSPNSKPAQIACASGNTSTGTTCSVGNETMGVTVSVPRAGLYEACFNINQDQSASGAIRTIWAVHETEENSLTILQEGLKRTYIGQGNTAGETRTVSGDPCGVFNFSAGRHTVRALYMQQGSGVVASSVVVDRAATAGGRNLSFKIIPYTQNFPQAVALSSTLNTWSPNITGVSNLTGSPTITGASYSKIGNQVNFSFEVTGYSITSTADVFTAIVFNNLPFAMSDNAGLSAASVTGTILAFGPTNPRVLVGTLYSNSSGNNTDIGSSFGSKNIGALSSIKISGSYRLIN